MKIIARWELDNISSIFNLKSYFQMTAISSLVLLLLFTIVIPFILKWQPYLQYKEMETSLYQQKPWFPLRTGYIPGFKAWVQQGAGKPPHASHSVLTHWHQQDLAGFSFHFKDCTDVTITFKWSLIGSTVFFRQINSWIILVFKKSFPPRYF